MIESELLHSEKWRTFKSSNVSWYRVGRTIELSNPQIGFRNPFQGSKNMFIEPNKFPMVPILEPSLKIHVNTLGRFFLQDK